MMVVCAPSDWTHSLGTCGQNLDRLAATAAAMFVLGYCEIGLDGSEDSMAPRKSAGDSQAYVVRYRIDQDGKVIHSEPLHVAAAVGGAVFDEG